MDAVGAAIAVEDGKSREEKQESKRAGHVLPVAHSMPPPGIRPSAYDRGVRKTDLDRGLFAVEQRSVEGESSFILEGDGEWEAEIGGGEGGTVQRRGAAQFNQSFPDFSDVLSRDSTFDIGGSAAEERPRVGGLWARTNLAHVGQPHIMDAVGAAIAVEDGKSREEKQESKRAGHVLPVAHSMPPPGIRPSAYDRGVRQSSAVWSGEQRLPAEEEDDDETSHQYDILKGQLSTGRWGDDARGLYAAPTAEFDTETNVGFRRSFRTKGKSRCTEAALDEEESQSLFVPTAGATASSLQAGAPSCFSPREGAPASSLRTSRASSSREAPIAVAAGCFSPRVGAPASSSSTSRTSRRDSAAWRAAIKRNSDADHETPEPRCSC